MRRRKDPNDDGDNGFAQWGGYMAAKKSKLQEQFTEHANATSCKKISNIFQGVSIFVNGYTDPSSEELKRIMAMHGGIYHHYQNAGSGGSTHIIASNLPDVKVKQLGANVKVVKPTWISESVAAGKLLDYKAYLLYNNQSKTQPKLSFTNANSPSKVQEKSPNAISSNVNVSENNLNTKDVSMKIRTAIDPNFLAEFYNNSRLHLISTLGAAFKQQVNELRSNSNGLFPARRKLTEFLGSTTNYSTKKLQSNKIIMHIDMDCFFVSVGLLTRPELKGLPVAVTHARADQRGPARPERQIEIEQYRQRMEKKFSPKNTFEANLMGETPFSGIDENNSMSEIASCSYEARKAGVKNGMFLGTACKICPDLKTMPYDFNEYKRIAHVLYDTIAQYTLEIEAVSCDEMFVDITQLLIDSGASVEQWATFIRSEIKEKTKCPCSTGFGENRLQARLATRKAKPDGQFYLVPDDVEHHMLEIDVNSLPGVGRALSYKLKNLNLKTCADIQELSLARLQFEFGNKIGEALYDHCRGKDDRPLSFEHIRKSVSAEVNYGIRFSTNEENETFLKQLCAEVQSRLSDINMKGKCITLKYMVRAKDAPTESSKFMGHGLCDNITKSSTLPNAVSELAAITREVISISRKLAITPSDLRGVGIQISRLEKHDQVMKSNALTKFFQKVNNDVNNTANGTVSQVSSSNSISSATIEKKKSSGKDIAKTSLLNFIKKNESKPLTNNLKRHNDSVNCSSSLNDKKSAMESNTTSVEKMSKEIPSSIFRRHKSVSEIENEQFDILRNIQESKTKSNSLTSPVKRQITRHRSLFQIAEHTLQAKNNAIVQKQTGSTRMDTPINVDPREEHKTAPTTSKDIESEQLKIYNEIKDGGINRNIISTMTHRSAEPVVHRDIVKRSRGRGRPRGSRNSRPNTQAPPRNNIQRFVKPISKNEQLPDIDPSFLNALPEDIRNEILAEYNRTNKSDNPKTVKSPQNTDQKIDEAILKELPDPIQTEVINEYNLQNINDSKKRDENNTEKNISNNGIETNVQIDESILNELPADIRLQVIEEYKLDSCYQQQGRGTSEKNSEQVLQQTENKKANLSTKEKEDIIEFHELSWTGLKNLLKEWFEYDAKPQIKDVNIFAGFTYELATCRKLEKLYRLLKFLNRNISLLKNCEWHRAFKVITERANAGLIETYGATISVDGIKCEMCRDV